MIKLINQLTMRISMTLVSAILLVICIMLLADKCTQDPAQVVPVAQEQSDKVAKVKESEKKIRDSVEQVIKKLTRENDSTKRLLRNVTKQLDYTLQRAAVMATEIELARQDKDTSRYKNNCDSLSWTIADIQLQKKKENEAMERAIEELESIILVKDIQLKAADSTNKVLTGAMTIVTKQNLKLTADYNKVARQNGRKYSVGPSLNFGIGPDGRMQFTAGISIQRALLKLKL